MRISYFSDNGTLTSVSIAGSIDITWRINQVHNDIVYIVDGVDALTHRGDLTVTVNGIRHDYSHLASFEIPRRLYIISASDYQAVVSAARAALGSHLTP